MRRDILFIAVVALALVPAAFAKNMKAEENSLTRAQREKSELERELRRVKKLHSETAASLLQFEKRTFVREEYPAFHNIRCNCIPGASSCTEADFKQISSDPVLPDELRKEESKGCLQLFLFDTELLGINDGCRKQVDRCGEVALLRHIHEMKGKLKALGIEMDALDGELTAKKAELKDLQRFCPDCAQNRIRKPTDGEYLIAAMQALTPALGASLSTYSAAKAFAAQTENYSNYLDSCAQMGIPCQQPFWSNNYAGWSPFAGSWGTGGMNTGYTPYTGGWTYPGTGFSYQYGYGAGLTGAGGMYGTGGYGTF